MKKTPRIPRPVSLFKDFRDYQAENLQFASPATINQFNVSLNNFYAIIGHRPTRQDLTKEVISRAMAHMLNDWGNQPPTVNKFRANLVALANWLKEEGKIFERPRVAKLVEPDRIPVGWDLEQIGVIFDAFGTLSGQIDGIDRRIWWTGLSHLFLDSAERAGAILQLLPDDFDLYRRHVKIRAEYRKWKKRDRLHPLRPVTCEFLSKIINPAERKKPVFSPGVCYGTLLLQYRVILRSVGFPHSSDHLFHCWRKTAASLYERFGGNATELLDHATRSTTVKYYLDPSVVGLKGPAQMPYDPGSKSISA